MEKVSLIKRRQQNKPFHCNENMPDKESQVFQFEREYIRPISTRNNIFPEQIFVKRFNDLNKK